MRLEIATLDLIIVAGTKVNPTGDEAPIEYISLQGDKEIFAYLANQRKAS